MSQYLINNEPIKIMLVAPESESNNITKLIPKEWNIQFASSINEANQKIDSLCALMLIDSTIIDNVSDAIFDSIRLKNSSTRIVLVNNGLDKDRLFKLFNTGKIHRTIDRKDVNLQEIESVLQSAGDEFMRLTKDIRDENLIQKRVSDTEVSIISQDRLLDLSLRLSDTTEIKDFTNQFVSMIEGIQSFLSINFSIYKDIKEEHHQKVLSGYLSDLELLANQYDQRILMIYVEIIRSYLNLLFGDIEEAMSAHKNCVRIFYWLSTEYIDKELVEIINEFPLMEDDFYYIQKGEREFEMTSERHEMINNNISQLLSYNIHKLTNISETLYKNLKVDTDVVQSILVVRDSLPIFVFENKDEAMDSALISGFVDALSSFLQELVSGEGDIDQIQHDKGVILIHKEQNLRYLLVANHDEVYLRMGLRQFAKETVEDLSNIPMNTNVNDEEYVLLKWKIEKLFKL